MQKDVTADDLSDEKSADRYVLLAEREVRLLF